MCKLCDEGKPQNHFGSRRNFLKAAAATAIVAASSRLFAPSRALAAANPPTGAGSSGRRYIIRGGSVMSMDPHIGDFANADVLIEGKKIVAVGLNLSASDAE